MTQSKINFNENETNGLAKLNNINLSTFIHPYGKISHTINKSNTKTSNDYNNSTMAVNKNNNIKHINYFSFDKDFTMPIYETNKTKLKDSMIKYNFNKMINLKARANKDPVVAFFNRNFYSCEVPIPKKIADNQKILGYYLKDKEAKEKNLKFNKFTNKNRSKSLELNSNSYKRYDIKNSLMLDNFSLYNRIHQVVRFWSKFINYACPIFQVQKFNLNSLKYKNAKKGLNMNRREDSGCKSSSIVKISKLPRLYTNSSKVFNHLNSEKDKFLRKNNSLEYILGNKSSFK